jgi:hypothetical protein
LVHDLREPYLYRVRFLLATILFISVAFLTPAQRQGIRGRVVWVTGNQMPGPGQAPSHPQGIRREIWIYEPTFLTDARQSEGVFFSAIRTKLIKKVRSKSDGRFKTRLPPGHYSLFSMEKKGLFANLFDGQGRINPIEVKAGEYVELTIRVDYTAAY